MCNFKISAKFSPSLPFCSLSFCHTEVYVTVYLCCTTFFCSAPRHLLMISVTIQESTW